MFHIKMINHQDITKQELNEIIAVKSTQWHHNYDQQLKWIDENIKETDIHVLLLSNNINVAYLNLIDIDLVVNDIPKKSLGVGNVCAIEKGKGYGFELMKEVNKIISDLNKIGILFCKVALLNYYSSLNWKELKQNQYRIDCGNSKVMVFNIDIGEKTIIDYDGILF